MHTEYKWRSQKDNYYDFRFFTYVPIRLHNPQAAGWIFVPVLLIFQSWKSWTTPENLVVGYHVRIRMYMWDNYRWNFRVKEWGSSAQWTIVISVGRWTHLSKWGDAARISSDEGFYKTSETCRISSFSIPTTWKFEFLRREIFFLRNEVKLL